jgi:FMN phosphatase YigB (HAD superfamily)
MIDTILFDLDGTLLQFSQDAFLGVYLAELRKVFIRLNMEPEKSIKAVLVGTQAMIANDGTMLNSQRFWDSFVNCLGLTLEERRKIETACDTFYISEFNAVRSVMKPNDISRRLVKTLAAKGYAVVLTTNRLFPGCAVMTRLDWIGLTPWDFKYITHYSNNKYCKPNAEYYNEIFKQINKKPEHCIMVGNSPADDMCVGRLGAETFLVTDYLENEAGLDITAYNQGKLVDLDQYLTALPIIN